MKFSDTEIEIDRELSELDKFAIKFTDILQQFTEYAIVSGYVSILLGRSRSSEDIDILIPRLNKQTALALFKALQKDFYCINTKRQIYSYIKDNISVRFAKKNTVIPNIELKFAKNKIDLISLKRTLKVKLRKHTLTISNLEMQIAFKEKILKSPKDIEDARHIRIVAKEHLNFELIDKYRRVLNEY